LHESAAELPRILIQSLVRHRDANVLEHLQSDLARRTVTYRLVQHDCFDELIADSMHRAECCHWLLRNQSDFRPANRAHLLAVRVHLCEVNDLAGIGICLAVQKNLAAHDSARRFNDPKHCLHRYAFAAATLADNAKDLAGIHVKGHAINRLDGAFIHKEMCLQVAHGEQRLRLSSHRFFL
jgi:hypothetical protein